MPGSAASEKVLKQLKPDRGWSQRSAVKRNTGLSERQLQGAIRELEKKGILETSSSGKKVRLLSKEGLREDALKLLEILPPGETGISSVELRSRSNLSDDAFRHALSSLRESQIVDVLRGSPGGMVRRNQSSQPDDSASEGVLGVRTEAELYEPFRDWYYSSQIDDGTSVSAGRSWVNITASGRGRRRSSGTWSRPDITAVEIFNYEYLPGAQVTVYSFEVKRAVDAEQINSVYEAAAHGRIAHRPSLVVEAIGDRPAVASDEILKEIERWGLGLYSMRLDSSTDAWAIKLEREPDPHTPIPERLNECLEHFFQDQAEDKEDFLRRLR